MQKGGRWLKERRRRKIRRRDPVFHVEDSAGSDVTTHDKEYKSGFRSMFDNGFS